MCFSNCCNSLKQLRTDFLSLKPPNIHMALGRIRNSSHSRPSQQSNKGSESSGSMRIQENKESAATHLCMNELIFTVSRH